MSIDNDDVDRDSGRKIYQPETGAKKVIVSHKGGKQLRHHQDAPKGTVEIRPNTAINKRSTDSDKK